MYLFAKYKCFEMEEKNVSIFQETAFIYLIRHLLQRYVFVKS